MAVWTLILQSEPEGPALISCAARLLRSDSTFANLLLAPSWRTNLGHLECNVATRADDLRADLDQPFLESRQRAVFDRFRRRQRAQEIPKIVGERMKLEADGVGGQGTARQPGPFDRALALFDPYVDGPLLARVLGSALIRSLASICPACCRART